jgi:hypothetical protein
MLARFIFVAVLIVLAIALGPLFWITLALYLVWGIYRKVKRSNERNH